MPRISDERLTQLEDIEQRYNAIAHVAGLATSLATEFSAASAQGAGVDEALVTAEAAVRTEYEVERIEDHKRDIRYARGEEIRREIRETRDDELKAQAQREFEESEEPELRARLDREIEASTTYEENVRLHRERPEEIKAEIIAERGEEIRAAERERFAREDESSVRTQTERDVERELARGERDKLVKGVREKVRAEKFTSVEQEERQKAELTERIKAIQEAARSSHRIPFELLRTDDVLSIELVEHRTTFGDKGATQKPERVLRLSVRDEKTGTMLIIDDSWQNGRPLERAASLPDGTIVVISTAVRHNGEENQKAHQETANAITRGVALRIRTVGAAENPGITEGYEVNKVFFAPEGEATLLLGTQEPQSTYNNWR